ncbi:MAG: hypothetical protein IJJ26_07335 [Victivallales bacterium]|nr:hypothetical protein [Victivallales bacterium]
MKRFLLAFGLMFCCLGFTSWGVVRADNPTTEVMESLDKAQQEQQARPKRKKTPPTQLKQRPQMSIQNAKWHQGNLERHWDKHKAEFPEYHSAKEYGDAAVNLLANPPQGSLWKSSPDDRKFFFPPKKDFIVVTQDGYIKTYFRPNAGINYWNRQ